MGTNETPENVGAGGVDRSDPLWRGMGDLQRAIRNRWPIPRKLVERTIERLGKMLEDAETSREVARIARVLAQLDALNMEQEKRDQGIADRIEVEHSGEVTQRERVEQAHERIRKTPGAEEDFLRLSRRLSRN